MRPVLYRRAVLFRQQRDEDPRKCARAWAYGGSAPFIQAVSKQTQRLTAAKIYKRSLPQIRRRQDLLPHLAPLGPDQAKSRKELLYSSFTKTG
jgi:hypothetical protein